LRFQGFVGPSYKHRSLNIECERCINLYPETIESGRGKEGEVTALIATPGLLLLSTIGDGSIRGQWWTSTGAYYVVSGDTVYKLDSGWNGTEIGTLDTGAGPVSMADNGTSLVIVDGIKGYVVTLSSDAFAEISDGDFLPADQVVFQDGYFIFNRSGTGQFFISGLNSTDFDALDIATSEGQPDPIIAILSDHRDLWLFNAQTTEVFFNSGDADFPFQRVQGAFIEHGCAATFSVAKMNNTVFWLGRDDKGQGVVYMAQGYQPQRISTHPVEQAIQSYDDISDAVAYCYQQDGHHFYVLNFSSASTTWVYDASTGMWHERVYTNDGQFERHRADNHAFAHGTHVVGDYVTGRLYELSPSTYSDNGDEITRQRITPHVSSGLKGVTYNSLQLDIEAGVGIDGSGQGDDPQAMLRWSDDGGRTWSNEKWVSFGAIGQTKTRAIWRRLGMARDRVFEVTITDPVKVAIVGAEIDLQPGAA
jgi:hypothetical protein